MKITENEISNDFQNVLIHCKSMEFTTQESLTYIESRGYKIHRSTFFRAKHKLKQTQLRWIRKLGLEDGLLDQHISRLEKLETTEHEMWLAYNRLIVDTPERAISILPGIYQIQPYISQCYRAIKNVLEAQAALKKRMKEADVISRETGR